MTPSALRRVSVLWDALERQPAAERAAWLAGLSAADAPHLPALEAMQRADDAATDPLRRGPPAMTGTGPSAPGESHAAGELVGPYRLSRRLGQGGMGEVWLARRDDRLLDRDVAIKLPLLLTNQATLRRRFERERNILAGLTHPNIARLYDAGVSVDGQPYMALEYVEGESISTCCDRLTLSLEDRIGLFLQVLGAVQYAHSRLVIHRDLKPSNILVTAGGEVRLLDFGIAKLLDDESIGTAPDAAGTVLTHLGGAALTLDFASPEQILQQPVGTLSDVYSLGVLLYELLCGERPCRWRQTSREALEAAVLEAPRPLPSSRVVDRSAALRGTSSRALIRQLRGDLDTIALKALKPLPADRYPSADALGADLRRWRDGEAVLARPDSRWYRVRRFVGRNRVAAGLAVLVAAGLSGGLGVASWQAQVARTEARTAHETEAFLTGLFQANSLEQDDPVEAQRTTARELLDRGSKRIAGSLEDAPEAKLRLLATLAALNRGLSLDETRYLVQRQRLALYSRLHPEPGVEMARELIDTAEAAQASVTAVGHASGLLASAERMLDEAGDRNSSARGRIELLKGNLADGDNCAALPHARRGVEILRRFPASAELVDGLLLQSQGETYCGDALVALATAEESIGLLEKLRQRRMLTDAFKMSAKAQMALGRMELSFAAGRKALLAAEAQHPPGSTPSSDVMNALASLVNGLVACAQPAEALALIEPRLLRALADAAHTDADAVVSVLIQKSNALVALNSPGDAAQALNEADALMKTFDADDSQRAMLLDARALALMASGDLQAAAGTLARASALHLQLHHAGSTQINIDASARVQLDLRSGDVDRATQDARLFFARPLASGQISRSEFEQRLLQAEIVLAKRQWRDARLLADAILSDIAQHPEPRYVRDQRARAERVAATALRALGRTAEAEERTEVVASIERAMRSPQDARTEGFDR